MGKTHVLLVQERNDSYWILPGGRVEEGEPSIKACLRELWEELGIRIDADALKFQFYFENLFDVGDRQLHEICVGYCLSFDQTKPSLDFEEVGVPRRLRWCHVDELNEVDLRPIGLSSLIVASSPCHAILGSFLGQ